MTDNTNPNKLVVMANWDSEAKVWVATSDDVSGLATESASLDALVERVLAVIPELLEDNAPCSPKLADYIREAISELEDTQDLLREARAALFVEQGASSLWQPIDTAPKDGTRIMLYVPASHVTKERVGEGVLGEESWYWANTSADFYWGSSSPNPTHWMPLPNLPSP